MRIAARLVLVRGDQLLVMHRNKFGSEYYALVGGGVDAGENPSEALIREVREETGLMIANPHLVYIEEAGKPYGTQYIYKADYLNGEPVLAPDSDEAKIHNLGQNLYQPEWLDITKLQNVPFLSKELKNMLLHDLVHGFSEQPIKFTSSADYETKEELGANNVVSN